MFNASIPSATEWTFPTISCKVFSVISRRVLSSSAYKTDRFLNSVKFAIASPLIFKLICYFGKLIDISHKHIHQLRIEMTTPLTDNKLDNLIHRPCFFIDSITAQSIKYICQCDDSSINMNMFSLKRIRIARAVPFFVMFVGYDSGSLQQWTIGVFKNIVSDIAVCFHHVIFIRIQFTRFKQNSIRNSDFTDIVHRGSTVDQPYLLLFQSV